MSLALCPLVVSVSSSSTLQILREASHLWGLLCQPVYLLGRFAPLRHVHRSFRRWMATIDPFHSGLSIPSAHVLCSPIKINLLFDLSCVYIWIWITLSLWSNRHTDNNRPTEVSARAKLCVCLPDLYVFVSELFVSVFVSVSVFLY